MFAKKLIAGALFCITWFMLVSCTQNGVNPAVKPEQITITIMPIGIERQVTKLIADFEDSYPHYTVEIVGCGCGYAASVEQANDFFEKGTRGYHCGSIEFRRSAGLD